MGNAEAKPARREARLVLGALLLAAGLPAARTQAPPDPLDGAAAFYNSATP